MSCNKEINFLRVLILMRNVAPRLSMLRMVIAGLENCGRLCTYSSIAKSHAIIRKPQKSLRANFLLFA
ncbi:MAG: hypothetical protein JSW12_04515, partial [Deltaproteobacteria bacterium]